MPNAKECTSFDQMFWGNIWGVRKEHNRKVEWLKDLERQRETERDRVNDKRSQGRVSISVEN